MNSAKKSESKSKEKEVILVSSKKKTRPHPDDDEVVLKSSNSKKLKTAGKSVSKSKMSTGKKSEVTFSDKVEEIKDGLPSGKENFEEEPTHTPMKTKSPSKQSLKSVKEHRLTPYSKMKEGDSQQLQSSATKQPNFNTEIVESADGDYTKNKSERKKTPKNSSRKIQPSNSKSKSPLDKINEEKMESAKSDDKEEQKVEEEKLNKEISNFVDNIDKAENKENHEEKEKEEIPIKTNSKKKSAKKEKSAVDSTENAA